jgi:CcmD family protein
MNKILVLFFMFFCSGLGMQKLLAQTPISDSETQVNANKSMGIDKLNPDNLPNAGIMYENGKIYLVVLVLLTIFVSIIIYLIRLEIKINKLEKEIKSK